MTVGIVRLSVEPLAHKPHRSSQTTTRADSPLRGYLLGPEGTLLRQALGLTTSSLSGGPFEGSLHDFVDPDRPRGSEPLDVMADRRRAETSPSQVTLLNFQVVPLVVHAPSGYGKSLLLESLAATWGREHVDDRVLLIRGADFARTYASAQKLDDVPRFQQRYQRADLVLLDDLQQLQRKSGAQRALCSILDHRQRHDRPTVLAANQPLRLLALNPRLISRLASGLALPLELPSAVTRHVIVTELLEAKQLQLTLEAQASLDEHEPLTVPQLIGLINQLHQVCLRATHPNDRERFSGEITVDHVRQVMTDAAREPIEARDIVRWTASFFGLNRGNLTGTSRRKLDVLARSIAMHLMRTHTDLSFQQIGRYFGNRDHTTVMHACKKIAATCQSDSTTRNAVREIGKRLKANGSAPNSAGNTDSSTRRRRTSLEPTVGDC